MISRHDLQKIYRVSVVSLALAAVLICGGFTTGRQITVGSIPAEAPAEPIVTPAAVDQLVEAAPDEDQNDGQMATSSGRRAVSTAYFLTGLMVKTGSDDSRLRQTQLTATPQRTRILARMPSRPLVVSSSVVASDLGRQFTLVGAKPSGTS